MTDQNKSKTYDALDKCIQQMDFPFFAYGNHKIDPETFFSSENKEERILLDVRSPVEYESVHLPLNHHNIHVLHIPVNELPDKLHLLPKDKLIATFCTGTQRASITFAYLRAKGFSNTKILLGTISDVVAHFKPGKLKHLATN